MLDAKSTFNDGSRALCIARPSMHILEALGTVRPFLETALPWRYGRSYFRGHLVYNLAMAHGASDKYEPMYNLQQQYIEQYLYEAALATGLIDVRWQSEVTGLDRQHDGATVEVQTPLGSYTLSADYVLAADGARSGVRSLLGLRLRGENYEGRYVIADVRMDHDFPTERRAFFEPSSNPGGTVLIHKQPHRLWRIDYQLRDGESDAEAIREPNLRARLQAILADVGHTGPWELEWWSVYTANTLCLDDYRHGRVFFIGDSAHIVPIFGVRGLNNGLADAFNVGWKLGLVLNGEAGAGLLESYSPERRGATLDVFQNARKSTRFMTPPSRGWALAREAALSLAISHDFTRDFANPRQMQPYSYSESPLTPFAARDHAFAAGPACGNLAANARLVDGRFLLDLAGDGFTGLLFTRGAMVAEIAELLAGLRRLDRRFTSLHVAMSGSAASETPTAVDDTDGAIAASFGAEPGTFYLLRPDLHVAGRWKHIERQEIVETLRIGLGRAAP